MDYAIYSCRLPTKSKLTLQAAASVTHTPAWRIITHAVDAYVRGRSAAEQRQIATWAKRKADR